MASIYLNKKKCGIGENFARGIRNAGLWINPESIDDWNPESIIYDIIRSPESSTWNQELLAWNPESKTTLDSLTLGDKKRDQLLQETFGTQHSHRFIIGFRKTNMAAISFFWKTNIATVSLFGTPIWPPSQYFGTPKWPQLHQFGILIWPPFLGFGKPIWPPFHCFGTLIWPP